jgi:hypothetical protein
MAVLTGFVIPVLALRGISKPFVGLLGLVVVYIVQPGELYPCVAPLHLERTLFAGQSWVGSPQYVIDNENGFNDPDEQGPNLSQSITLSDSVSGALNCGPYAAGPTSAGDNVRQCN